LLTEVAVAENAVGGVVEPVLAAVGAEDILRMLCGLARYVAMSCFSAENELQSACHRDIICQRNERPAEVRCTEAVWANGT
jgi:hypothetical protein